MYLRRCILKPYCSLYFQQSKSSSSTVGFIKGITQKPVLLDKSEYKLVYTFNYMPFIAASLKSRFSVPIAAFVLNPFLYYFDETHTSPIINTVSGIVYFLGVQASSKTFQNIIGKIYANKEGELETLIVSSVNSYGKRTDRMHKAVDFINNDPPNKFVQFLGFTIITIENSDIKYKLNVVNGKCIDPYICDILLGKIFNPKFIKDFEKLEGE